MTSASSSVAIPILTALPLDPQAEIFSYLRTVSASRVVTICKENGATIADTHQGYIYANQGRKIQLETIEKLKISGVSFIPLWMYTKDLDALELIGKQILDLNRLYKESIKNPGCFIEYIFDKRILLSLQKNWITFNKIVDLLTLQGDPAAEDTVDSLFRSQALGEDILQRLGEVLAIETKLREGGIEVDQKFIAEFLELELQDPQCYEMYLDDLITSSNKAKKPGMK